MVVRASVLLSMMVVLTGCPDLPCADTEPRCDPGYVCLQDPLWPEALGKREVCKKTEAKRIGQACQVSEECQGFDESTAVCADMSRACPTGTEAACDLRCRPVCQFHEECGPDQICWPGGGNIPGVCQEGECGADAIDCPDNLTCLWFKPGATGGICLATCDILRQQECRQAQPPSDAKCCQPQNACIHSASNPAFTTCLAVGTGLRGDNCDTEESNGLPSCNEGLFCSDLLGCLSGGNCTGQCYEYCRRIGTGAPQCSRAGAVCNQFPNGANLEWGYCN